MKRLLFQIALLFVATISVAGAGNDLTLLSPDGHLKLVVRIGDTLSYDIYSDGAPVMVGNSLSLTLVQSGADSTAARTLGARPRFRRASRSSVDETLKPLLAMKSSTVRNRYNSLSCSFRDGWLLEFRAFDDGVAYRFVTALGGEVDVLDEEISLRFPADAVLTLQQANGFRTSYEEPFTHLPAAEWKPGDKMAHLPLLAGLENGVKVLLSETDLRDYPAVFFRGEGDGGISTVFPKAPLEFQPERDRRVKISREAKYIAHTSGSRSFPWRYFVVTRSDGELVESTLPVCLAGRCEIDDPSWIRPGQASWEWWNGAVPYGPDVDFVGGCNLPTYRYFIDFAANYGIPYIVMDEGWALDTRDPFTPNPEVDLHELLRYGSSKGVGIILWVPWLTVENNPDIFERFEQWGVAGIKVDFMDRSDQWMVNFYERTVAAAARHHLFIDFHGAFKPSGLEYRYPNLLSYEGVLGMEQMGRCTPQNSLWLPFTRNVTGAMEYTPGAMLSMQPEHYVSKRPNSASIGTRAYQMALFVVFESGIQMLADNPTLYYRNDECTRFITSVPVLWDETRSLAARAGEYVLVAKRSGDKWFIGGITAERKEPLTLRVPLDFLDGGREYSLTLFRDTPVSAVQAMDYRREQRSVAKGDVLEVTMVRNGGFAAVLDIACSPDKSIE